MERIKLNRSLILCFFLAVSFGSVYSYPNFTHPEYYGPIIGDVDESEKAMTLIGQITALPDENDTLAVYYYVKDIITMPTLNQPAPFWMDPDTGELFLMPNSNLDYDTVQQYRFTICAANSNNEEYCGDPTDTSGAAGTDPTGVDWMVVNVLEVTNSPVWDIPVYNITLLETASPQLLHYATASDLDPTDVLQYSIASTAPAGGPFSIDPLTGEFSLTGALDFQTAGFYDVITEVTDGLNAPVQALIYVKVINQDEPPVINNVVRRLQFEEDQTGINQYLFTPTASDKDGNVVTLNFTCTPLPCPFYMNGADQVFLDDTYGPINWETQNSYTLFFTASNGNQTTVETTRVDILNINEPPVFINLPANWTVQEDEPFNRHVYEVWVKDPENDTITYTMFANPRDGAGWAIDANGQITMTANPGLNHDINPNYHLSVFASDGEHIIGPEYIDIEVVDVNEPPTIMNLPTAPTPHQLDFSEAMTAGSQIMRVVTFDPDLNETYNYSLLVSPVGGNGMLDIDKWGNITIGADGLDFEAGALYTVQVTVIDSGGLWDQSYFTLTVEDHPEPPRFRDPEVVSMVFTEEQVVGDPLPVLITATDPDIGDILTYSLMPTASSGAFTLDTSGNPPVLRHGTSVDYDTASLPIHHNLKIQVTDSYGLTDWMWVDITYVDINDNTPYFTAPLYVNTIEENLPVGASVLTVTALDDDINFNIVYYSIDPTDPDSAYFDLDPYTGVLTVTQPLDYESDAHQLDFDVIATDNGGLTTTSSVTVYVTDQNDNAPYMLASYYNYEVRSDAFDGYAVGPVYASDIETGTSGISYDLDDPSGFFYIDASSGLIYANGPVDVDETYTLQVTAWDVGVGQKGKLRSSPTTVRVDSYLACEVHVALQLTSSSSYSSSVTRAGVASSLGIVFDNSLGRVVTIDGVRPWLFTGSAGSDPNITVMWLADSATTSIASLNQVAKDYVIIDKYQTKNLEELINKEVSKTEPISKLKSAIAGGPTFVEAENECPPPPKHFWTQTAGGIFLQSLLAILGVGGLGALLSYGLYRLLGNTHIIRTPFKCRTCYHSKWCDQCVCRNQCKDNCCPPKKEPPPPKAPKAAPKVPDNAGEVRTDFKYHRDNEAETIFRNNRVKPERAGSDLSIKSITDDQAPLKNAWQQRWTGYGNDVSQGYPSQQTRHYNQSQI